MQKSKIGENRAKNFQKTFFSKIVPQCLIHQEMQKSKNPEKIRKIRKKFGSGFPDPHIRIRTKTHISLTKDVILNNLMFSQVKNLG